MSRHLRVFLPLIPLTLSLALPGCGQLGTSELAESAGDTSVCEHQWLLESLSVGGREHRSGLLWKKLWRDRPYLTCDKLGYVRGSAGNNPYLGRFALSGSGELSWSQAPVVSRMSNTRDSSELEKDYLKALPQTDRLTIKGDFLILQGDSGATRLEFKRVESGKW